MEGHRSGRLSATVRPKEKRRARWRRGLHQGLAESFGSPDSRQPSELMFAPDVPGLPCRLDLDLGKKTMAGSEVARNRRALEALLEMKSQDP